MNRWSCSWDISCYNRPVIHWGKCVSEICELHWQISHWNLQFVAHWSAQVAIWACAWGLKWRVVLWDWALYLMLFFFFFLPHEVICRILAPWPGIKPWSLAVEAGRPNHWTTREGTCTHGVWEPLVGVRKPPPPPTHTWWNWVQQPFHHPKEWFWEDTLAEVMGEPEWSGRGPGQR